MVLFVSLHAKHIKQTPCVVEQLSKTGQLIGTGGQERRLRASCSAPSRTPAVPRRPSFRGRTSTPGGANRSPLKSRFIDARCMHAPRAASSTARHWARMSGGNTVARGLRGSITARDREYQVSARSSCEVHLLSVAVPVLRGSASAGAVGTIFCLATRVAGTVRAMSTSATESNSIGFIGGGMMATALMNGFLKGKAVPSAQAISVSEPCTCARLNLTRAQSPV